MHQEPATLPAMLEVLVRSSEHQQIILLTESDTVAGWARVEAMTGAIGIIEPTPDRPARRPHAVRDAAGRRTFDAGADPPGRRGRLDDTGILEIYNHEVLTSVVTFDLIPRTEAEQREWIADRSGAHVVIVATVPTRDDAGDGDEGSDGTGDGGVLADEEIVGFGALSPYRERPGYSTTVEDSVYVHRDHQGEGSAGCCWTALVETATAHGFHALMAKIVGGHDASIALHAAAGFEIVGQEREVGRKFGRFLDVVLMERLL